MKRLMFMTATLVALSANSASADWVEAACMIYPAGSDQAKATIPCTFGQRQGYITITRSDGVTHDLSPVGDSPGNYRDQDGRTVYRQSGLGDQGQIFRLPDESIFVYWDASILEPPPAEDNPAWPFTTADYDATTTLRCRAAGDSEFGNCPAGIARMEDGQASITVQNQMGEKFTINFMKDYASGKDYVNATNRELTAKMQGDTWILHFANGEVWEVPLAAVEGG